MRIIILVFFFILEIYTILQKNLIKNFLQMKLMIKFHNSFLVLVLSYFFLIQLPFLCVQIFKIAIHCQEVFKIVQGNLFIKVISLTFLCLKLNLVVAWGLDLILCMHLSAIEVVLKPFHLLNYMLKARFALNLLPRLLIIFILIPLFFFTLLILKLSLRQ